MCDNFFDVRTFGAVMSTGINAGQVRGPVQLAFAQSVEPILPLEISITRMAATNEKEKAEREKGQRGQRRAYGKPHHGPQAYRALWALPCHMFINAKLAERTGFAEEDLDHLFEALGKMFEHDRSAARGEMSSRHGIAFKHAGALGNAPAHELFDRVRVRRAMNGSVYDIGDRRLDNAPPTRRFEDYVVEINRDNLPSEIEIVEFI